MTSTIQNQSIENGIEDRHATDNLITQAQIKDHHHTLTNQYEIHDLIYGNVLIQSQCAIEIILLPEFQRLQNVLQHGISGLIGLLPSPLVNRFDHSIGAMILVKHVGGSEEAQLAALLHDVSHTALSHVTDSVFGYVIHEVEKVDYLSQTKIPSILEKYGFDPRRVFNEELFTLLESPSPQLCADRLDYALRDSVSFGYLSVTEAREIYKSTIAVEGRMVLNAVRAAKLLGEGYLKSDQNVWANSCQAYLYKLAAQAIKLSLVNGSIDKQSLWKYGDEEFWNLLRQNADDQVKSIIERINSRCYLIETKPDSKIESMMMMKDDNNDSSKFIEILGSDSSPTLCRLKLRVRTIDPLVKINDNLLPLTSMDSNYRQIISDYVLSRQSPITFVVRYSPLPPQDSASPSIIIPAAAR